MTTATTAGGAMSAREVRQAFQSLGYKVSLRTNPFRGDLVGMVVSGQGLNRFPIGSATVMGCDTYASHKQMFELATSLRGKHVGQQKLC